MSRFVSGQAPTHASWKALSALRAEWAELRALIDIGEPLSKAQQNRLLELEQGEQVGDYVRLQQAFVEDLLLRPSGTFEASGQVAELSEGFVDDVLRRVEAVTPRLRVVTEAPGESRVSSTQPTANRLQDWRYSRSSWKVVGVIGGMACAAGAFLYLRTDAEVPGTTEAVPLVPLLTYSSGATQIAPRFAPGSEIVTGDGHACVEPAPGVDVCLGPNGRARYEGLREGKQVFQLQSGSLGVLLDGRARDSQVSVVIGDTVASAADTAFVASAEPGERGPDAQPQARISVLRGAVRLTHASGAHQSKIQVVSQSQSAQVTGTQDLVVFQTTPSEQVAAWRLLEPTNLWRRTTAADVERTATLKVEASLPIGVRVDGVELGRSPVSVVLGSGLHRVTAHELSAGETLRFQSVQVHEVQLEPGAEQVVRFDLTPIAPPAAGPLPHAPSSVAARGTVQVPDQRAPQTPYELLSDARRESATGQWGAAATTYRQLRQNFPGSAEAHTVLVALGDIERLRRGNPTAALSAYQAYLQSGGPLAQEARSGKVHALRMLGRKAAETSAIHDYLRSHPGAVEAAAFRKRLDELQ